MKTKNIAILLFILVCLGVALLGYSQAWAQECKQECASDTGILNETCTNPYDYNIEVYPPMPGTTSVPCPKSPGEMCWPYKYQGCSTEAHDEIRCAATKKDDDYVPTANYFVLELNQALLPLYGGASIGSQLEFVDIGPKCTNAYGERVVTSPGKVFLKLNFALNCGFNAVQPFEIYFKSNQLPIHPVRAFVVTSSECLDNYSLNAPTCVQYECDTDRTFCDGRIAVTYDPCFCKPTQVLIDGELAPASPTATICEGEPDPGTGNWDPADCHALTACGSGSGGCYICTDPPIFIEGGNAHFKTPPAP